MSALPQSGQDLLFRGVPAGLTRLLLSREVVYRIIPIVTNSAMWFDRVR
jgi:hypothetical protein